MSIELFLIVLKVCPVYALQCLCYFVVYRMVNMQKYRICSLQFWLRQQPKEIRGSILTGYLQVLLMPCLPKIFIQYGTKQGENRFDFRLEGCYKVHIYVYFKFKTIIITIRIVLHNMQKFGFRIAVVSLVTKDILFQRRPATNLLHKCDNPIWFKIYVEAKVCLVLKFL